MLKILRLHKALLKKVAIAGICFFFLLVFFYVAAELQESKNFNPRTIVAFVRQYGPLSWLIYVLVVILSVITLVPDSVVNVAGSFIFGPVVGGILSIIGFIIGTAFNFLMIRKLGRSYVAKRFPSSAIAIDKFAQKLGWQTVFIFRVLPSVTFDFIGYAAGISSMPFWKYMTATLLGAIPTIILQVSLGGSLRTRSFYYIFPILIFGLIFITTARYFTHKYRPKTLR